MLCIRGMCRTASKTGTLHSDGLVHSTNQLVQRSPHQAQGVVGTGGGLGEHCCYWCWWCAELTCSWEFPRLNGEGSKVAGCMGMGECIVQLCTTTPM